MMEECTGSVHGALKSKKKAPHWEAFRLLCGTIRPFMSPGLIRYATIKIANTPPSCHLTHICTPTNSRSMTQIQSFMTSGVHSIFASRSVPAAFQWNRPAAQVHCPYSTSTLQLPNTYAGLDESTSCLHLFSVFKGAAKDWIGR
jgi:hypothetical protein